MKRQKPKCRVKPLVLRECDSMVHQGGHISTPLSAHSLSALELVYVTNSGVQQYSSLISSTNCSYFGAYFLVLLIPQSIVLSYLWIPRVFMFSKFLDMFFFFIDKHRKIILKEGSKKATRSIQEVYTRSPTNKKHKEAYTHQLSIRTQPIYKVN